MRPVVFIDVDGVFNKYFSFEKSDDDGNRLDDKLIARFKTVVQKADAQVVTLSLFDIDKLRARMAEHGILDVIDQSDGSWRRGDTILKYVAKHHIESWAIVDDEAIPRWRYYDLMADRLIKVDGLKGFSGDNAYDLARTLNPSTFWEQGTINRIKNAHKLIKIQQRYIKRLEEKERAYLEKYGRLKS